MSHFAVLVIGENPEEQLEPFHEFECTGVDKFIVNVDKLQEAREAYAEDTERQYVGPDGERVNAYDDRFYRLPTEEEAKQIGPIAGTGGGSGLSWHSKDWGDGKGCSTRIHYLPEGWKEEEVPKSDVKSFRDFVEDYYGYKVVLPGQEPDLKDEHKFGWCRVDAKGEVIEVIDRTNPKAKWDWYQLGGRYTGFFTLKGKTLRGKSSRATLGKPGLMTEQEATRNGRATADQAIKKDIDIGLMRREAEERAAERYDEFRAAVGDRPWPTPWPEVRAKHGCGDDVPHDKWPEDGIINACEEFNGQDTVKALANHPVVQKYWGDPWTEYGCSRGEYLARARAGAIVTFAVLKDGEWYERGEMGWWGTVSNEKDGEKWNEEFTKLFDALPDDTLLSMYDCHI